MVVWGFVPPQVMVLSRMVAHDPHATNVFFACLAAVFSALVGPLFLFHANLATSNMTTVEYVSGTGCVDDSRRPSTTWHTHTT